MKPRVMHRTFSASNLFDARDHVTLENSVDDVHPVDDLTEYRVVATESQIIPQVDEPLRVACVVAACANPDRAADVRHGAQLIAKELRIADVFVRSRTSTLNDKIVLDAMPRQ